MEKRFNFIITCFITVIIILAGCDQKKALPEKASESIDNKLEITVSIIPQKYFVEQIGGKLVHVNVMVKPGDNPAIYEPKPEQLRALSRAVAYFRIGVAFEQAWQDRFTSANSKMIIVDTARGIERMPMRAYGNDRIEDADYRETKNLDPHIWLSPQLVKIQAQIIYDALVQLDPARLNTYQANLTHFLAEIDELDTDIHRILRGITNRKFMVFHPAWGYFARDYKLEMISIEVGGQEPSAAELASLITKARSERIQVIFAQPEFRIRDAETIAKEIGGRVLRISPLAPDWADNLRQIANTFAAEFN